MVLANPDFCGVGLAGGYELCWNTLSGRTVAAVGGLIMGCLMNGSGKTLDDPRRDR